MRRSITIRERLSDRHHIELAEPVEAVGEEVEVIIRPVRGAGETIPDKDSARISPLMHRHVIPNGTYHFARSNMGDNIE